LLDDEEKLVFGVGSGCSYTSAGSAGGLLLSFPLGVSHLREIVL
jgi:hypothetical protein